jgi:putative ABC transport system permease protein
MTDALRHAVRRLLHDRGFTVAATLTLSLGIGAAMAVFTVINAVLLRPLPYARAERLVSLSHTLVVGSTLRVDQSDASILFFSRHNRSFDHLGGYQMAAAGLVRSTGSDAERLQAGRITADLFAALSVAPIRGRVFSEADDRPRAAPVAVISERLWMRTFAADPNIVGQRVHIDGVPHEVIGIIPEWVRFPAADTELWLPLGLDPAKTESATFDYQAVARLRDGVSVEDAERELQTLLPRLPDEFPGRLTRGAIQQTKMRISVRPLADVVIGDSGRLLWIVFAAVGFLLAIACANVANLFLVRAERRRTAFAIQRALGAAPRAILAELLWEGLLISFAGGIAATALAAISIHALRWLDGAIDIPRLSEVSIDSAVVGVCAIVSVACAVFVSVLPILRFGSVSMTSALGSTSRSATSGRDRHRARHALVVTQVSLALVLLVGSGLMARSVWRLRAVQPGFDAAEATTFRLALPAARYAGSDDVVRFFNRAADRIESLPGVVATGVTSKVPLDEHGGIDTAIFVEDRPIPPGSLPAIHPVRYVTPGYFAAARIPFLAGRPFAASEPPDVVLEVVISRSLAERYWKGDLAIGRRVRTLLTGPSYTIVGIVGNVRDTALDQREDQIIYVPVLPPRQDARWSPRDLAVVVRTAGDPSASAGAIRDAVRQLDPSLPMYRVRTFTDILSRASSRRFFTLLMIACASGMAILLGAIGLYGVMSYVVALRTREMGIRIALGAPPDVVRRMVTRQGVAVSGLGVVIGLFAATAFTRFLASLLFEVSPTDTTVLALSAGLLLTVAFVASYLPARRAAAIDPAITLRAD